MISKEIKAKALLFLIMLSIIFFNYSFFEFIAPDHGVFRDSIKIATLTKKYDAFKSKVLEENEIRCNLRFYEADTIRANKYFGGLSSIKPNDCGILIKNSASDTVIFHELGHIIDFEKYNNKALNISSSTIALLLLSLPLIFLQVSISIIYVIVLFLYQAGLYFGIINYYLRYHPLFLFLPVYVIAFAFNYLQKKNGNLITITIVMMIMFVFSSEISMYSGKTARNREIYADRFAICYTGPANYLKHKGIQGEKNIFIYKQFIQNYQPFTPTKKNGDMLDNIHPQAWDAIRMVENKGKDWDCNNLYGGITDF